MFKKNDIIIGNPINGKLLNNPTCSDIIVMHDVSSEVVDEGDINRFVVI